MHPGSLRRLLPAAFFLMLSSSSFAQPAKRPLPLHVAIQDKDFYLLSVLQRDAQMRTVLTGDKALGQVSAERQGFLKQSLRTCKGNAVCTLRALLWTDEEIRMVSFALGRVYRDNAAMRKLVNRELEPRGTYVLYEKQGGESMLVNAWEVCARGLNDVISVYGQGAAPRYPAIDSISFDVNSADFQQSITALASQISTDASPEVFFEPSLKAALQLLTLNHRDEAGRLEPMETGVNAAAVKEIGRAHV